MRYRVAAPVLAVALAVLTGCSRPTERAQVQPGEGFVTVPGGRVWYQIVGGGNATPLVVLHGGPGGSSYYLKPMEALANERPVIFYDQLGGGRSERPKDNSLWRMERFVDELEAVRRGLGLREVHLYGHSFGTMILADYYRRYVARRQPWAPEIDKLFAELNTDVYVYMQGPSEFTITGTLKDYDATAGLREIKIPTLFTTGRYDEARPETVQYYQSLVPGAQLVVIEESGHITMQDQPDRYIAVIRDFLRSVESR